MVDSGADGTLLPKALAPDLGLDFTTDLVPTSHGSGGAGGTSFPTWTTANPITGQVVAMLSTGPELWGPEIAFAPVFADGDTALFGRSDFFAHFTITFVQEPTHGPVFQLDY